MFQCVESRGCPRGWWVAHENGVGVGCVCPVCLPVCLEDGCPQACVLGGAVELCVTTGCVCFRVPSGFCMWGCLDGKAVQCRMLSLGVSESFAAVCIGCVSVSVSESGHPSPCLSLGRVAGAAGGAPYVPLSSFISSPLSAAALAGWPGGSKEAWVGGLLAS